MSFIKGERLRLKNAAYSLKNIKRQLEQYKEFFTDSEGLLQQFDEATQQIAKQVCDLPVGHRYDGEFYLKKPGMKPPLEFEKKAGALFMREDLTTWGFDKSDQLYNNCFSRVFYKKPSIDSPIQREDGKPVFDDT